MLDTTQQTKFAKQCGDAAFGYAQASMEAYGALFEQSMRFWAQAGGVMASKPKAPATPELPFPFSLWQTFPGFAAAGLTRPVQAPRAANPYLAMWEPAQWMAVTAEPAAKAFNPWTFWLDMVASPRAVTANPIAVWMMAFGVPQSVARPAAEAHAAALDAAETATKALTDTFQSHHRSDSGYAVAQVITPKKLALSMLYGPAGAAALMSWPWGGSGHGL